MGDKAKKRIRVLMSKLGLDGHDRGLRVVTEAMKEAGMEVIYLGRHMMPEEIVQTAIQENVDVIGLSNLSDSHRDLAPVVIKLLRERGAADMRVILGGFIPSEDIPLLKSCGIAEVFGVDTPLAEIVEWINVNVGGGKRSELLS